MQRPHSSFRLRSFVRRDSRTTAAQERAYESFMPQFGLPIKCTQPIDFTSVFSRKAPCYLEIGFGSGISLLELAKTRPDLNLIGVETHKPGIGALLMRVEEHQLTNLRIFHGDIVDILATCIADASLDGIQIFFPDPWPKRRHHPRRLLQTPFLEVLCNKLVKGGSLHLATDWQHYAAHMLQIVTSCPRLSNPHGAGQYGVRSIYRPIVSKFEARALSEGRAIWELQLANK